MGITVYCIHCGAKHEIGYGQGLISCAKCGKAQGDIISPEKIIKMGQLQPQVISPNHDKTPPKYTAVIASEDDVIGEIPQVDSISLGIEGNPPKEKLGNVLGTNTGGEVIKRPRGKITGKRALMKQLKEDFKPVEHNKDLDDATQ